MTALQRLLARRLPARQMQAHASGLFHLYRGQRLPIRLLRRKNTVHLRLTVASSGEIRLSTPVRAFAKDIAHFLAMNQAWLDSQLDKLPLGALLPVDCSHGSRHPYLGGMLTLVLQAAPRKNAAISGRRLILQAPDFAEGTAAALLQAFYRQQSLQELPKRTAELLPRTPWVAAVPEIRVRRMKTQWGSCAQTGFLTLNTHLIKAAPHLIDHVILHELCHLQEFNHSSRFYQLLETVDPNWQVHKAALDAQTAVFLN